MKTLLIAEQAQGQLKPETAKTIFAASQLQQDCDVLLLGEGAQNAAEEVAKYAGVSKVLVNDNKDLSHYLAENTADLIVSMAGDYSHIVMAASTTGKNILPRVAALLDVSQISEIIEVIDANTFKRPIYAGNAIATVSSSDTKKVITVRAAAFDKPAEDNSAPIETVSGGAASSSSRFIKDEQTESERPDLGAANVVISGGRGMQNGENFALLEGIADKLGAAIGASRAAVDAGFVPNDMQVGQTGKIVAPELYIAVGISGAIQHLAGMKDSKVIVAINKDEDAPIFQVADYGLVADLFDVLPELENAL